MNTKKRLFIICLLLGIVCLLYVSTIKKKVPESRPVQVEVQTATKNNLPYYKVVHVADGDTIDIIKDGKKIRLRLLGINSPESVAQNRPDECFGSEASTYMKSLVAGREVRTEYDPQKPMMDEYGRHLMYVWLPNDLFVNKDMIEKGYAYEYTYHREQYTYQKDFKTAQNTAQKNKIGLWAQSTCNGKK